MATNRNLIFANDQIYHVYNRGVERRPVFISSREHQRMLDAIWLYRYKNPGIRLSNYFSLPSHAQESFRQSLRRKEQLVSLLGYCLMPNHFHFVVKQRVDDGIARFVSNVSNSYAKYFNTKRKRIGPLFQGAFKAVLVETEEQLLHLTRYVHLNPVSSFLLELADLDSFPWSSFPEYLSLKKELLCDMEEVRRLISLKDYRQFVFDQVDYAKKIEKIKHLSFEE